MKTTSSIVPAARFTEMLADDGEELRRLHASHTIISGMVRIDGKKTKLYSGTDKGRGRKQSIDLRNLTFLDRVEVEHCSALMFTARGVNFRKGLSFQECSGSHACVHDCQMTGFDGYHNKFEVLSFDGVTGEPQGDSAWTEHPSIDISGFAVAKHLNFYKVQARELLTISHRVEGCFTAPAAITDDLVWATQLRLLGVPVHMSTDLVRKMLEAGGAQHLVRAA